MTKHQTKACSARASFIVVCIFLPILLIILKPNSLFSITAGLQTSMPAIDINGKSASKELAKYVENKSSAVIQDGTLICDYSHWRFNICTLEGDVRVLGNASSVILVSPPSTPLLGTTFYKIRPFTRKWETGCMSRVRELTIKRSSDNLPACDVMRDIHVVIFDLGGYPFNPFHAYTDLLIPLFVASYRYNGKIQFAATNYNITWINLYKPLLDELSHYPIIDLDSETLVHCFPSAQVGIKSHGPLAINPNMSTNRYTMQDFRHFIRTSLSLERAEVNIHTSRLCILLRNKTRVFTNRNEIIEMVKEVGFEVVPVDTETTKSFPKIARIINSCDVLMGLHGAGMANMLYLPNNGTLLQILPWGDLKPMGRWDYGDPSKEMEINYVEYEIKLEESTLVEKYPRDHAVLTNPSEIHKQGWEAIHDVYLIEQNVKLDVDRFRGVLVDVLKSLN